MKNNLLQTKYRLEVIKNLLIKDDELKIYVDNDLSIIDTIAHNNRDNLNHIALIDEKSKITYYELINRVNQLSFALNRIITDEFNPISIIADNDISSVITLLGINQAHKFCTFINPSQTKKEIFVQLYKNTNTVLFIDNKYYQKYKSFIDDLDYNQVVLINSKTIKNSSLIDFNGFLNNSNHYFNINNHQYFNNSPVSIINHEKKEILLGSNSFLSLYKMFKETGLPITNNDVFYNQIGLKSALGQNFLLIMPLLFGSQVYLTNSVEKYLDILPTISCLNQDEIVEIFESDKAYNGVDWQYSPFIYLNQDNNCPILIDNINTFLVNHNAQYKVGRFYECNELGGIGSISLPFKSSNSLSLGYGLKAGNILIGEPNTLEVLGNNQEGLIFISSPTHMLEYNNNLDESLNKFYYMQDNKLLPVQQIKDLNNINLNIWYCTGDMGYVNDNQELFYNKSCLLSNLKR